MSDTARLIDRFRTTLDLWATGVRLKRQAIRRLHPRSSEDEIERLLTRWLQDRPGAELGDGPPPSRTP